MADQKEQIAEQQQQNAPNSPLKQEQSNILSSEGKSFFRKAVFFVVLAIILVVVAAFLLKGGTKKMSQQEATGTVAYTTGLPKDQVVVQLFNDEDIERYPVADLTVASLNVFLNTFEGLTIYHNGNLVPGLAVSWTNPNPTTWRFKLRRGVHFQSGDLFIAKDVKYTIEQAKASANNPKPWFSQTMADRIDSVNIIDDYTVDLKTKAPDATLLNWLAYIAIVSQSQVQRDGLNKAVGTGPYKIVSIASRETWLEANENYWGGTPKVKKLGYKVIPDPQKAKMDLENGNLNIAWLSPQDNNELVKRGLYGTNFITAGIDYILLDVASDKSKKYVNTVKNPFKDVRVRKAMLLALDMPGLIKEEGINAEPVTQFATSELVGFNPHLKATPYDLTEAKNLLTEAGFPNGFSATLETDTLPDHLKILQGIKKQWAKIGINININTPQTDDFYNLVDNGDFSMMYQFYYPDTLDSIDLIDTLFHTKTGRYGFYNVSNFSDPQLDSLIEQAEQTFNTEDRVALTNEAHRLIMEEVPSIPLYSINFEIFARNDLVFKPALTCLILGYDISGRQQTQ